MRQTLGEYLTSQLAGKRVRVYGRDVGFTVVVVHSVSSDYGLTLVGHRFDNMMTVRYELSKVEFELLD